MGLTFSQKLKIWPNPTGEMYSLLDFSVELPMVTTVERLLGASFGAPALSQVNQMSKVTKYKMCPIEHAISCSIPHLKTQMTSKSLS